MKKLLLWPKDRAFQALQNGQLASYMTQSVNEQNKRKMFVFTKNFRKLGMLELCSIICGIFHTSIRYQMFLYILIENFTVHLVVESLGQTIETVWKKIKNKIWPIFSGPPVTIRINPIL
jgi:hypothetical protein